MSDHGQSSHPDDSDAIRRLLHAYTDAVLARAEAVWGALWTDDARWELGPDRVVEGRDQVLAHWKSSLAAYQHVVQLHLSNTATVDGDVATGRAYLLELNVPISGPRRIFVGWYDDVYRRTVDGWRFSRRSLTRLYSGPPDLSGDFAGLLE